MPMQHVFSFTIAEAWAFLIYAAGAAAGLYAGGVAISKVITAIKSQNRPGQTHYPVRSAGERYGGLFEKRQTAA